MEAREQGKEIEAGNARLESEITELKQKVKRRDTWLERMKCDYNELYSESESLREEVERLTKERDELMGDNVKLKARVAELEARNPEPQIILPN